MNKEKYLATALKFARSNIEKEFVTSLINKPQGGISEKQAAWLTAITGKDWEWAVFHRSSSGNRVMEKTARTEHICGRCCHWIEKGQKTHVISAASENRRKTIYVCEACWK